MAVAKVKKVCKHVAHMALLAVLLANRTEGQTQQITIELPGGVSLSMVWIEPGSFRMGDLDEFEEDPDEVEERDELDEFFDVEEEQSENDPRVADQLPEHTITISSGFWLGRFEVTQSQWESVMETRPWESLPSTQRDPDRPASFISWNDAQLFVARLNEAAGDSLYRLPTEAEWEYACRAGGEAWWSSGGRLSLLAEHAWYERNAWDTGERFVLPVGTRQPNPWGLFDM